MSREMTDRVAMVTGAASGIGRATARRFAGAGATVVLADVQEAAGEGVAADLRAEGADALFVRCDVSRREEVEALMEKALETYGRLDCAFNNAGVEGEIAASGETSEENWDHVMGVNLKGAWLCMRHEIPAMLPRGSGSIVNCASVAGSVGFPGLPAYVASKHGVLGLTRTAAIEYAGRGLRINAVCPGVIQTPMIDRITGREEEARARLVAMEPVGRMGLPEEVAEAVVWLCSDAASFVTGHALAVDGGMLAR